MRGFTFTSLTSSSLGLTAAGAIHDSSHCPVPSMQSLVAPASEYSEGTAVPETTCASSCEAYLKEEKNEDSHRQEN
jgi:hypothetical protein